MEETALQIILGNMSEFLIGWNTTRSLKTLHILADDFTGTMADTFCTELPQPVLAIYLLLADIQLHHGVSYAKSDEKTCGWYHSAIGVQVVLFHLQTQLWFGHYRLYHNDVHFLRVELCL